MRGPTQLLDPMVVLASASAAEHFPFGRHTFAIEHFPLHPSGQISGMEVMVMITFPLYLNILIY